METNQANLKDAEQDPLLMQRLQAIPHVNVWDLTRLVQTLVSIIYFL